MNTFTKIDQELINYINTHLKEEENFLLPLGELPHPHIENVLGSNTKTFSKEIKLTNATRAKEIISIFKRKPIYDKFYSLEEEFKQNSVLSHFMPTLIKLTERSAQHYFDLLKLLSKKTIDQSFFNTLPIEEKSTETLYFSDLFQKYTNTQPIKLFKLIRLACEKEDAIDDKLLQFTQEILSVMREITIKYINAETKQLTITLSTRKFDFLTMSEQTPFHSCYNINGEYSTASALCMQNENVLIAFEGGDKFTDLTDTYIKKQRVLVIFSHDYKNAWFGEVKPNDNPQFVDFVEEVVCDLFDLNTNFKTNYLEDADVCLNFSDGFYLDLPERYDEDEDEDEQEYNEEFDWSSGYYLGKDDQTIDLLFDTTLPHYLI